MHDAAHVAAAQISLRGTPRSAAQEVETLLVEWALILRGKGSPLDLYAPSITSTIHLESLCLDREPFPMADEQGIRLAKASSCLYRIPQGHRKA